MKWITCALLVLSLLGALPTRSSAEGPLTILPPEDIASRFYTNPSNLFDIGDPHILPAGGKYYAFATGGTVGYNVWESSDLRTWGNKQKALRKVEWAAGDYWAPEVYPYQDRYVMLFSVRDKDTKGLRIGIAFADEPQGPYEDPLGKPLFQPGYSVIDASLLVDDGIPYLYYVRDCSDNVVGGNHESHVYGVQLSVDLLSFEGEPAELTRPDQPWELDSGGWLWNEGPVVVKHDSRYYLYYSAHYFADPNYSVGAALSDTPLGPFTKQADNPLLAPVFRNDKTLVSGPGHNSFFTAGGELFTSYHSHKYPQAPSGNRQLNIDRAGFRKDGTACINGPTLTPQLRPLKDLGLINAALSAVISVSGGDGSLLADGDYGIQNAAFAFLPGKEGWAELAFPSPVHSDLMMIYPAFGTAGELTVLVNGEKAAVHVFEQERLPGEALILHYEPLDIRSLRLELSGGLGLSEVIVTAGE